MKDSQGASVGTLKALNKNDKVIIPQKEKNLKENEAFIIKNNY